MDDLKQKDLTTDTEITQEMVEITQPPLSPDSADLSSSRLEQKMEEDLLVDIEGILKYSEDGPFLSFGPFLKHSGDGLFLPFGPFTRECCIYKVPQAIRDLKEEAYAPKFISIGPFHYCKVRREDGQRYKQLCFKRFTQKAMTRLHDLVSFIRKAEPKVRASYSENIPFSKKELVKLILVDAAFIIQLFIYVYEMDFPIENAIIMDLVLLENQLPFFVIEDLFSEAFPPDRRGNLPSFIELTYMIFGVFYRKDFKPNPNERIIRHFTELLRLFHLPTKPQRLTSPDVLYHHLYSANQLHEAGVKFRARKSIHCDLKFSKPIFEIPQIFVDNTTEFLFHNMIAFELCHCPNEPYLSDYASIIDSLIRTNEDVDFLIRRKIICKTGGDTRIDDVATLFSGLPKNSNPLSCTAEYRQLCKDLNKFCQHPWRQRKAALLPSLKRDYCGTPWKTAASLGGIILLILTVIQTIFSVLQVVLK